eukprot:gene26591-33193_t
MSQVKEVSSGSGGALFITGNSQTTVSGCSFNNNAAEVVGQNITITLSMSPFGGAIYCAYQSNVVIDSLVATHNSAAFSGGVVALFDSANASFSHSTFTSNTGSLGGVFSGQYETRLVVMGSSFSGNRAGEHGGVGYFLVDSTVTATGCTFTSNTADLDGGVFSVQHGEQSSAVLSGNTFTKSLAKNEGGVLVLGSDSSLMSTNNLYSANAASTGAVMQSSQSTITSKQDTYTECVSQIGGCIYAVDSSEAVFADTTFTQNNGQSSAASVLFMEGGSVSLTGCHVTHNSALQFGAINLYSTSTLIYNCTFASNVYSTFPASATVITSVAAGAALYFTTLTDLTEAHNNHANISISNTIFTSNDAGSGDGGAIYVNTYPGDVVIQNCVFNNNSAANGGAISAQGVNVTLKHNEFTSNQAAYGGGAVYWVYSKINSVSIAPSNTQSLNTAAYGDFKATNLVQLNSSIADGGVASSGGAAPAITIVLLDFYNQIVTNSTLLGPKETQISASTEGLVATIKGNTIVQAVNGIAVFNDMEVTADPGSNATLVFNVPISYIADVLQFLPFRPCISGEMYKAISNDQAVCEECGLGTYSFAPTEPCQQRPVP